MAQSCILLLLGRLLLCVCVLLKTDTALLVKGLGVSIGHTEDATSPKRTSLLQRHRVLEKERRQRLLLKRSKEAVGAGETAQAESQSTAMQGHGDKSGQPPQGEAPGQPGQPQVLDPPCCTCCCCCAGFWAIVLLGIIVAASWFAIDAGGEIDEMKRRAGQGLVAAGNAVQTQGETGATPTAEPEALTVGSDQTARKRSNIPPPKSAEETVADIASAVARPANAARPVPVRDAARGHKNSASDRSSSRRTASDKSDKKKKKKSRKVSESPGVAGARVSDRAGSRVLKKKKSKKDAALPLAENGDGAATLDQSRSASMSKPPAPEVDRDDVALPSRKGPPPAPVEQVAEEANEAGEGNNVETWVDEDGNVHTRTSSSVKKSAVKKAVKKTTTTTTTHKARRTSAGGTVTTEEQA
ncbi:unnamed protein product [Amoebophrya sp. A120]|nr:unnamed protein product [Amoebophrya sp. A120]|eukprot:GSA120T00005553001.1